jgi:hypothetical protein
VVDMVDGFHPLSFSLYLFKLRRARDSCSCWIDHLFL